MNIPNKEQDYHFLQSSYVKLHYPIFYKFVNEKYSNGRTWMERLYMFFNKIKEIPTDKYGNKLSFISINKGYAKYTRNNSIENKNSIIVQSDEYPDLNSLSIGKLTEKSISKKYPKFYNDVKKQYSHLNLPWIQILYLYMNNLNDVPECIIDGCHNKAKFYSIRRGYSRCCCQSHAALDPQTREKFINTCQIQYGCDNVFQNDNIKGKIKRTIKHKYNVDNPSKSKEIQNKKEKTCLKNYGVEHPAQSLEIQEITKQTNIKKYGVKHTLQSPDVRNKIIQTNIKKYGAPYGFFINKQNNYNNIPNKIEQKVIDYLKELREKPVFGAWSIIKNNLNHPLQLDVYLEDRKIAFEINGSFYHSLENPTTSKNQHIQKHILCQEKGIELVYLWEDWIKNDWDSVKDFIKAKLNGDYNTILKYKHKWFSNLNENEWPLDLGFFKGLLPNNFKKEHIKKHICKHGNKICYDSGILII